MHRRSLKLIALSLLLWLPALWPAPPPHAFVVVPSSTVSQPQDWTSLAAVKSAREAWYTAIRPAVAAPPAPRYTAAARFGTGACGGILPPCSVLRCESHGSLTAQNPSSSASGKWQILDTTWGGFGGYMHARDAPEDVQDERAAQIYAGGSGRSQWVC